MTQGRFTESMVAAVERLRTEWLLLGYQLLEGKLTVASSKLTDALPPGSLVPTFMCTACWQQQLTIVTSAQLPGACPKCHAPLTPPSGERMSAVRRAAEHVLRPGV